MMDIQREFLRNAKLIPNFNSKSRDADLITEWADKYCDAFDAGDEKNKNIYISALMLKFWDNVDRIYKKVKAVGYTYEDCVSVLYKCIAVACEYRAWRTKPTTAKACINQTIASRGAAEILYSSNRDNARANVNSASLDCELDGSDSDDAKMTLMDTLEDENSDMDYTVAEINARSIIQACLDRNKVIEAIILDTYAFTDCQKTTKETKKAVDANGNEYTYKVVYTEPWNYRCVQHLNELSASYVDYFLKHYNIQRATVEAALESIHKSNNQKLYRFIKATMQFAKTSLAINY